MNKDRLEYYSHLTVTVIGISLAAFLIFRYLFVPILPFLIGWGVAFAVRPVAISISRRTKISRSVASVILAILCVVIVIGAVVGVAAIAINEGGQLLSDILNDERLYDILAKITNPLGTFFGDGEGSEELREYLSQTLREAASTLLSGLVSFISAVLKKIPSVLFFILITVIASIYFAVDIDKINAWVLKRLPDRISKTLVSFKNGFFSVFIKYARSYLFIMLITFVIVLIGLLILRVKNALLISLLLAVLDVLPLIGVGTVLVPWSIFELIFGSTGLGIGLVVLFVALEIIRQLAEPKIVGKSLGLHPIASLLLLYLGYSLLGIAGLLLTPLVSVVINVLINKNNSAEIG